jgi:hypothetical protein
VSNRAYAAIVNTILIAGGAKASGISRETVRKKKFKCIEHRGNLSNLHSTYISIHLKMIIYFCELST